jgi:hypothetical protein
MFFTRVYAVFSYVIEKYLEWKTRIYQLKELTFTVNL